MDGFDGRSFPGDGDMPGDGLPRANADWAPLDPGHGSSEPIPPDPMSPGRRQFAWELLLHPAGKSPTKTSLKLEELRLQKVLKSSSMKGPTNEETKAFLDMVSRMAGQRLIESAEACLWVDGSLKKTKVFPGVPRPKPKGVQAPTASSLLKEAPPINPGVFVKAVAAIGKLRSRVKIKRYLQTQRQVGELMRAGKLAVELPPDMLAAVPYFLQGGTQWYTPDKLHEREELKKRRLVQLALDKWWMCVPKDPETGGVTQHTYKDVCRRMFYALFPPNFAPQDVDGILHTDWLRDSKGHTVLDEGLFLDAIFEFADVWSETDDMFEYVKILDTLFSCCFPERRVQFPPIDLTGLDGPPPEFEDRLQGFQLPPEEGGMLFGTIRPWEHWTGPAAESSSSEELEEEEEELPVDDRPPEVAAWQQWMEEAIRQVVLRDQIRATIRMHVREILAGAQRREELKKIDTIFQEAVGRGDIVGQLLPWRQRAQLTVRMDARVRRLVRRACKVLKYKDDIRAKARAKAAAKRLKHTGSPAFADSPTSPGAVSTPTTGFTAMSSRACSPQSPFPAHSVPSTAPMEAPEFRDSTDALRAALLSQGTMTSTQASALVPVGVGKLKPYVEHFITSPITTAEIPFLVDLPSPRNEHFPFTEPAHRPRTQQKQRRDSKSNSKPSTSEGPRSPKSWGPSLAFLSDQPQPSPIEKQLAAWDKEFPVHTDEQVQVLAERIKEIVKEKKRRGHKRKELLYQLQSMELPELQGLAGKELREAEEEVLDRWEQEGYANDISSESSGVDLDEPVYITDDSQSDQSDESSSEGEWDPNATLHLFSKYNLKRDKQAVNEDFLKKLENLQDKEIEKRCVREDAEALAFTDLKQKEYARMQDLLSRQPLHISPRPETPPPQPPTPRPPTPPPEPEQESEPEAESDESEAEPEPEKPKKRRKKKEVKKDPEVNWEGKLLSVEAREGRGRATLWDMEEQALRRVTRLLDEAAAARQRELDEARRLSYARRLEEERLRKEAEDAAKAAAAEEARRRREAAALEMRLKKMVQRKALPTKPREVVGKPLRELLDAVNATIEEVLRKRQLQLAMSKARALFGTDQIRAVPIRTMGAFSAEDPPRPPSPRSFRSTVRQWRSVLDADRRRQEELLGPLGASMSATFVSSLQRMLLQSAGRRSRSSERGKAARSSWNRAPDMPNNDWLAGLERPYSSSSPLAVSPLMFLAKRFHRQRTAVSTPLSSLVTPDVVEHTLTIGGLQHPQSRVLAVQVVLKDGRQLPMDVTRVSFLQVIRDHLQKVKALAEKRGRPRLRQTSPGPDGLDLEVCGTPAGQPGAADWDRDQSPPPAHWPSWPAGRAHSPRTPKGSGTLLRTSVEARVGPFVERKWDTDGDQGLTGKYVVPTVIELPLPTPRSRSISPSGDNASRGSRGSTPQRSVTTPPLTESVPTSPTSGRARQYQVMTNSHPTVSIHTYVDHCGSLKPASWSYGGLIDTQAEVDYYKDEDPDRTRVDPEAFLSEPTNVAAQANVGQPPLAGTRRPRSRDARLLDPPPLPQQPLPKPLQVSRGTVTVPTGTPPSRGGTPGESGLGIKFDELWSTKGSVRVSLPVKSMHRSQVSQVAGEHPLIQGPSESMHSSQGPGGGKEHVDLQFLDWKGVLKAVADVQEPQPAPEPEPEPDAPVIKVPIAACQKDLSDDDADLPADPLQHLVKDIQQMKGGCSNQDPLGAKLVIPPGKLRRKKSSSSYTSAQKMTLQSP
uniref:Uncharacterized protein n=1 Tax=Eutreptiella gymnastica TaxID=73025 RepID=A0A7S1IG72_9EUGL|mmetsp:Transcript_16414/g.29131  ORF Transcript_16414/g.29131 Transcript_16414/m.29131 type:complete len:1740 (+) Transcript_16414:130-5349(+)